MRSKPTTKQSNHHHHHHVVPEVPVVQWLSSQDMDTATRVQILDLTDCISHSTNTLGKGLNPNILPQAMGKQQSRLGSSALVRQLVQEKENSEFKPVKLRLKIDLVSYPARAEVFGKYDHHVVPPARISLTLSRHFSLSFIVFGRASGLHPVSSHNCCMYVRAGRPAFAWPYVGVHRSTSLMSSSLLLQQCPACLVRLTCIVFVMEGMWPYSWVLEGCCRQDLFNITLNILV